MYFEALGSSITLNYQLLLTSFRRRLFDALLYGTKGEKLELKYDKERGSEPSIKPLKAL
jgi:hypothetical protein